MTVISRILFKTKFYYGMLILHLIGTAGVAYWGFNLLASENLLSLIFGIACIGLSTVLILELVKIKEVKITNQELIFRYPLLFTEVQLPWEEIIKIEKGITTTKTNAFDVSYSKGRTIKIWSSVNKYSMTSFYYSNFDKFQIELSKRLTTSLRNEMTTEFNLKKKEFEHSENRIKSLTNYLLPIGLLILILMWLLS